MKANINEEILKEYGEIPRNWNGVIGYNYATDRHHEDGWRDVVYPNFDEQTEKLGELYFDEENDVVTYEVISKTDKEIQFEKLQEAKVNQQNSIQKLAEKKLIEELQNEEDEDIILENKSLYPIWEANGELIKLGTKLQAFNSENELSIFRCNQDVLATEQFEPKMAINEFTEILIG